MITDVKLLQYITNENIEQQTDSVSIFEDLVDEDFVLDYMLEFGDEFTFTGSSINMEFFSSSTLDVYLDKTKFTEGYFYGIEIYLDGNTSSEFWGYLDERTIEYDKDKTTWKFTVTDWIERLWNYWDEFSASVDFVVQLRSLQSSLELWIEGTVLQNVNIDVGDMNNILSGKQWLNAQYNLTSYMKEVQKHYGAYLYITADRTLNFINRMRGTYASTKAIGNKLINMIESGFEPKAYKAIAISNFVSGDDPNLFTLSGIGPGDSDVLIFGDGNGWVVPMIIENSVAIDDFDRALLGTFPAVRFNYLDLRQRLPTYGNYDPFQMLTLNPISIDFIAKRYNAYRNIFDDTLLKVAEVDGYDYDLLDIINLGAFPSPFGSTVYQLLGVKKFLQSERAILTLRERI